MTRISADSSVDSAETPAAPKHLRLLGQASVTGVDGARRAVPRGLQPLLCRLAIRGPIHREVLMDELWPDASSARIRGRFNTLIWRLRRFMSADSLVNDGAGLLSLTPSVECDVAVFEREYASRHSVPSAADHYSGDLLPGCFDDWVVAERERLRNLYLSLLRRIVAHHSARGELNLAIRRGSELCNADPLREDAQRELISLYLRAGQRAEARRQYEHCVDVLASDLGVRPMLETQQLGRAIALHGHHSAAPSRSTGTDVAVGNDAADLGELLHRCQAAIDALALLVRQIEDRLRSM